ncbi:MAG: hypothetical protein H7Z71_03250 [Moraxellaceae bacterium]|nr:hypothetical protein [Pseudobdellovibrionaceae bacterium]
MSIINSNTTGHSPKQERKFANKLFLGLGLLIAVAFVIFLLTSQSADLKTAPAAGQLPVKEPSQPVMPQPETSK